MDKIHPTNTLSARAPTQEEYKDLVKFLDENLRPQNKWSIASEYPTALNQENIHNLRIISEGSQVLSHAALKTHIIKTPNAILKAGAIGSVVTHDKYRNQGLSRMVLQDCIDLAKKQDCDFAILWTNLHEFYQKIGFALAGYEISLAVDENFQVQRDSQYKILKSPNVDPTAIYKLMSQHTVTTFRNPEEIRKYLNIPNSNVYTLWEPNGTLGAYCVEGKGADLGGYVHEWGGGVSKILQLLKYIQEDQKRTITIIAPNHATNLIEQCESKGASKTQGFIGMIKLINEEAFFKKIHKHARADLGITNLVLEKTGEDYRIGTTEQYLTSKDPIDIIPLIFGPRKFSSLDGFNPEQAKTLDKIFPMPFWLGGWDSV
jgi:N-acetylglutamate synthase-like GNAT family acetyltransferase